MKLALIPPNCPAPRGPHVPHCDVLVHQQLIVAVERVIDPPIYRASIEDHTYCGLFPCADCR